MCELLIVKQAPTQIITLTHYKQHNKNLHSYYCGDLKSCVDLTHGSSYSIEEMRNVSGSKIHKILDSCPIIFFLYVLSLGD